MENENQVTVQMSKDNFAKLQKFLEIEEKRDEEIKESDNRAKNANFIQLYRDNMPELRWLMSNHSLATSILFFILEHMDNRNALACSYTVLENYFKKHKTTIYRNIKILEENGFIDVLKMGTSNVYIVNEELAWTDKNTNKKFAKYDGKILVSKKENDDYNFKNRFDRLKTLREEKNLK